MDEGKGYRTQKAGFTPPLIARHYPLWQEGQRILGSSRDKTAGYSRAGFTIIEIVVMLAIITTISAIVLVSFTGLHEGAAVNRSARELALAIRRAQNMSFAVTRVDTAAGPKIPPAVGVRVSAGSPIYFIFADIAQDNRYGDTIINGAADAKVVNGETTMEGGITARSLTAYDALMAPRSVSAAHVLFLAPEAAVTLSDAAGASLGDILEIELASASGAAKKKIVVRTSGQISVK